MRSTSSGDYDFGWMCCGTDANFTFESDGYIIVESSSIVKWLVDIILKLSSYFGELEKWDILYTTGFFYVWELFSLL